MFPGSDLLPRAPLSEAVRLTDSQTANVKNGLAHVNIHTAANLGGEIRGQIVVDPTKASQVDLIFQRSDLTLAIWIIDGTKLVISQLLNPSNPGGIWKVVAPQ